MGEPEIIEAEAGMHGLENKRTTPALELWLVYEACHGFWYLIKECTSHQHAVAVATERVLANVRIAHFKLPAV